MKKPLREGRVAGDKCHWWKNSRVDNARVKWNKLDLSSRSLDRPRIEQP